MSQERSKGIVGIFILIAALFVTFLIFAFVTLINLKGTSNLTAKEFSSKESPIGVITVDGAIMDAKKVIEMLQLAEEEESIKAVILRVDSPGGAVAPTQEIYYEIRRIDKIKPIYSSFGSVAASGGYYIAAATRKIYANPGSLTGSIGVIMQTHDFSELYKFAKVKPEVIKAGKYKDIGSPSRAMTEYERKILEESLANTHQQFIRDIVKVRKDRLKQDPREFAQGQIFNGEEALAIGLVDELAGLWEAGRKIHKEMKFEGDFSLRFIKPKKKKFKLSQLLEEADDVISNFKGIGALAGKPAFLAPLK